MNELAIVRRSRRRYVDEDKTFWQKHLLDFEASGLAGATYCRAQGINCDRFRYWQKKLSAKNANVEFKEGSSKRMSSLLPVKILENGDGKPVGAFGLCTLDIGKGRVLQIHDAGVVELILSRLM